MTENRIEIQQTQKLSQSLQTVIRLLSFDLDALSEYMVKAVSENPALEYVPPKQSGHEAEVTLKARYRGGRGGNHSAPDIAAPAATLLDDLEQQLRLSALDPATRHAAKRMLRALSPRGYFTDDLDEYAAEAGISPALALRALEAIQALEPAGIGARTTQECLKLQLLAMPDADPLCEELVYGYLSEIAKGDLRSIAKATKAPLSRVRECVATIRALTPSPCQLDEEPVQYIVPEFSVVTEPSGALAIQFHNDYYPSLRLDAQFCSLAETLTGDDFAFARRMRASASQLIRAIELRQTTMEKVAQTIVREQRAFFLGHYSLLPLRIDETACEIGVSETTVYRAIQNKYLYCARGTFPLSHFFQREVSGGTSAARVKEIILELCRENGKLSDRAIAEALEKRGITLSRRTVAKYRAQMDIGSSFRRKADEANAKKPPKE